MRKMKALSTVLAAALVITGINTSPEAVLAAKKPSIGKSAEVKAGETVKIKVKNANGKTKVKWSISNKSKKQKEKVAKIKSQIKKGKKASVTVQGLLEGKAVVSAVITQGKKKFGTKKCTVTVKAAGSGNNATATDAATGANASAAPSTSASVTASPQGTPQVNHTPSPTNAPTDSSDSTPEPTKEADPTPTRTPKPSKSPTPEPTPKYEKPTQTAPPVVALELVEGCCYNENDSAVITYNDDKTLTVEFNKQWSAINFYLPDNAQNYFSEYKYATIIYNSTGNNLGHALFDADTVPDGSGAGEGEKGKHPDWGQKVAASATDTQLQFEVTSECAGGCIRGIQIFNPHDTGSITTINIKYVIFSTTSDISSAFSSSEEPSEKGFTATFDVDSHASITTYTTQDYTKADGTVQNATTALSRNGDTGAATTDGTGQVNFTVVPAEGYEVDKVEVTPEGKFSNIKGATDTKKADTYRVTKITGDITIKVTTKEKDPDAPVITSYKVEFEVPEHASITTYRTKAYDDPAVTLTNQTEAESWDTDGNPTVNGGQVNFKVIPEEGYEIESVTIDKAYKDMYKNLKTHADSTTDDPIPEGNYRITKIAGDLKVKITVKKSDGGNETPVVPAEYKATFVIEGGHATITTYTTQNYDSTEGVTENATEAVARDSPTGNVLIDGNGQINFTIVTEDGYYVPENGVVVTPEGKYKNVKGPSDTGKDNTYKVTKIKGDVVITITVISLK
jgi:hypothetical protein